MFDVDIPQRDLRVIGDMQQWLERAVIGLNLCPFAKAVYVKGQIHYAVCRATEVGDVLDALGEEMQSLVNMAPELRDTTLLVLPDAFAEFVDFNDFLYSADKALRKANFDGVLQIASFHPQYQFADAEPDAISNYTNRAPYPTLHLLREDSIDRAVLAIPDASDIFEANIAKLEGLGHEGWAGLGLGPELNVGTDLAAAARRDGI